MDQEDIAATAVRPIADLVLWSGQWRRVKAIRTLRVGTRIVCEDGNRFLIRRGGTVAVRSPTLGQPERDVRAGVPTPPEGR